LLGFVSPADPHEWKSSAERDERLIDETLVAVLTGDQREDYLEALLERAEVMKESTPTVLDPVHAASNL
jgi:hypothetical protein